MKYKVTKWYWCKNGKKLRVQTGMSRQGFQPSLLLRRARPSLHKTFGVPKRDSQEAGTPFACGLRDKRSFPLPHPPRPWSGLQPSGAPITSGPPHARLSRGTRAHPRGPPPPLAGRGDRWPPAAQGGAAAARCPSTALPRPALSASPPPPPPRSPHSSRGRTRQSPRTNSAASGDGAGPREARARSFPAPSSRPGRVIPGH